MTITCQDDHNFFFLPYANLVFIIPDAYHMGCYDYFSTYIVIAYWRLWILAYLRCHIILVSTTTCVLTSCFYITIIMDPPVLSPMTISTYDVFFHLFFFAFLLGFISSIFSTQYLVEGGTIWNVSMCFHHMITSSYFTNKSPCKYFVKKSASICYVLKYAINMLPL